MNKSIGIEFILDILVYSQRRQNKFYSLSSFPVFFGNIV